MEAIDKIRDTSTSHERCSIIEVMGRNAGYIALWCGIANGAEDILLPERYDNDEQALINHIIEGRKKGKKHHLIINAEGIGHSTGMARRIEAATGIETRATILGYMRVVVHQHVRTECMRLLWVLMRLIFLLKERVTDL